MPWKPLRIDEPRGWALRNKKRARFLVDESLGVEVANVLRGAGWNAVFASDLGLLGRSDEDVFAAARREDRILLTHDRDFLNDRVFRPDLNPGLVVLRPGAEGHQNRLLLRALGGAVSVVGAFREVFRGTKLVVHEDGSWTTSQRTHDGLLKRKRYRFPGRGQTEIWEEE
jgi:predicted nuclease of predicted toxin-antitoxin system